MLCRTGRVVSSLHISISLSRSALGYKWDFGTEGNIPYLCRSGMKQFSKIVENAYEEGVVLDSMEMLERETYFAIF